ncbi:MAG: cupredoxin domain-containing protein [Acidimicrobiia bacterium]
MKGEAVEIRMVDRPPKDRRRSRPLTWERVAAIGGTIECGLLFLVTVVLADLEALVVTATLATGLLFLRRHRRIMGMAGLGSVSAVVLAFMLTAAASNLSHAQGFIAIAIPSSLAVTALVVLTSAGAALARAPALAATRWVVRGAVALQAMVLLVALLVPAEGTPAAPGDVILTSSGVAFSRTDLVTVEGSVTVRMSNEDLFWHTFTIDELEVDLAVPVGATRSIAFEAPAGLYRFYCRVPGHPEAGMVGTLEVRE